MKKFLMLLLSLSSLAYAGETAPPGTSTADAILQYARKMPTSTTATAELLNCEPPPRENREATVRKDWEKSEESKEELLARIIFSESLSTGFWQGRCGGPSSDAIMENVGWGILNRVHDRNKNYQSIIFQPDQFATSFAKVNYKSNKPNPFSKFFLCPLKAEAYLKEAKADISAKDLFKKAEEMAKKITSTYEESGIPSKYIGIDNFFSPKSEYLGEKRPDWATDPVPENNKGYMAKFNVGIKGKECIESYDFHPGHHRKQK